MSIRELMTIALPNRSMRLRVFLWLFFVMVSAVASGLVAQSLAVIPQKKQQKKAGELIRKQDPPKVIPRVLERATPENISIYISLGKQRAYFRVDEEIAVDSPISSGKRAGMTPGGQLQNHGKRCRPSLERVRGLRQSAYRQSRAIGSKHTDRLGP